MTFHRTRRHFQRIRNRATGFETPCRHPRWIDLSAAARIGASVVALSAPASSVLAATQAAPGAPPAGPQSQGPTEVETVTVVGNARVRGSVDRRSYDIKNDLQYQSGSLADVLSGVPSVSVDPDGSVKLRGASGVTILIDGEPAPQVNGANQAAGVQQLRAAQFSRVEVMTNPSAAFSPEGQAGIINLISRKDGQSQPTTNITVGGGSRSAGNFSVSHSANHGPLSFNGSAGARRIPLVIDDTTARRFIQPADAIDQDRLESRTQLRKTESNASSTVGWQLDPKSKLTLDLDYFGLDQRQDRRAVFDSSARTSGAEPAFESTSHGRSDADLVSGGLMLKRTLSGTDSYALARLRVSRQTEDETQDDVIDYWDEPARNRRQAALRSLELQTVTFKAEYKIEARPGGELIVGSDLERQEADVGYAEGQTPGAAGRARDNPFGYDRSVASLYTTYKTRFGELEVLPGVRLEVADWVTRQGGNAQRTRDFEIYPTGHVRYTVAQDWIIGGSFTRRVDRLRANDLDETVKYSGPLSYFSGRRDLKPEKTSAYELELEHEASGRNYLATGYYRSTSNRIGTLSTLRPDGAILDRRANIGEFRTAGLELVASGSVGSTITYKLTGRFARTEVSGADESGSYRRSAWTPSSQANVNWKITDHDFVQINAVQLGEDLSQQRRREAFSVVNLGYRRKLADSLFLTATVSDLFDSAPRRERVRGETFDQDIDRRYDARRFTLSLSYAFGRRTGSLEDRFDYGN